LIRLLTGKLGAIGQQAGIPTEEEQVLRNGRRRWPAVFKTSTTLSGAVKFIVLNRVTLAEVGYCWNKYGTVVPPVVIIRCANYNVNCGIILTKLGVDRML
jgi:hypothetical protein